MKKLVKGDIVDIVAPASDCSDKEFKAALSYIESLGLVARYDLDFRKSKDYLAQSDDFRARDLMRALSAKDSKAVWCLRGGYGSLRLLDALKKYKKPKTQKWFLGLSDISILHQFMIDQWSWKPIHAPVLSRMGGKASAKEKSEIKKLLLKEEHEVMLYSGLKPLNEIAKKSKNVSGKFIGGNLCSLCSMQGSSHSFSASSKILFLEDISERAYAVDRMLTQLKMSANIKKAKAIVFGDFTNSKEKNGKDLVPKLLKSFASELNIPVYKGLKSGHDKVQLPIPFNSPACIKMKDSKLYLEIQCP